MRDFNVMWTGQTLSVFGSAVSNLALPSIAVLVLHATPYQLGLLEALGFIGFPTLGLFVGVLADRVPRRRVMMFADSVRALALATVPLAAFAHALTFGQLATVALVSGIASVFFEVCYQAYLPSLVAVEDVARGNTRLEVTRSAAQLGGTAIAGILISAVGAAYAVAIDAASFVVSLLSLAAIRKRESIPAVTGHPQSVFADLREGVIVVARSPVLRTIALCTATSNLGSSMLGAVILIYAYRELHFSAALVGIVFAFANAGFFAAAFATKSAKRFGLGRTLAAASMLSGAPLLLLPLASHGAPLFFFFVAELVSAMFVPIYNINQVSLRQTIVPLAMQGRMNATMRTFVWGTMPLGALLGGILGVKFGVIPALSTGAAISSLACLWIVFGPVFGLRSIDDARAAHA